jgi:outer membrane biosynthesis protein TonB
MYFDFYDNHPDVPLVGAAEPGRDRIVLSIPLGLPRAVFATVVAVLFHVAAIGFILIMPDLDAARQARLAQQMALLEQQRDREQARFVFVEPHLDMPATRALSPRAEGSDKDRNAQTRERAKNPTNSMPFSVGNTRDRVEAQRAAPAPPPPQPEPAQPQPADPAPQNNAQASTDAGSPPPVPSAGSLVPQAARAGNGRVPDTPAASGLGAGRGLVGSAMRDLRQMVQSDAFDNQGGGAGTFGPSIQFDTKGVEFGPWIRRFIAQIKRNWLIPYAAMAMKGHVAITFYIHKDGTISELAVPGPCNVEAFNRAAYNALATSNPTYPLPPEYPSERAFFTVIFYYNEVPPGGGS